MTAKGLQIRFGPTISTLTQGLDVIGYRSDDIPTSL
jgi:hypothetical protein